MKKKKIRKQLKRIARKQKRVLDDIYGLIGKLDGGAPIEIDAIIPVGLMKALLGTTNEKEESDDGPQIYGVKWDYSDPKNIPVRIGKCAGWPKPSPAGDIDEEGTSPFDDVMPWAGMKRYAVDGGVITGIPAGARDENPQGDIMVYIPSFWYRARKDESEKTWTWEVSPEEQEGFTLHPGSGKYISRYHTSDNDKNLTSCPGSWPLTNTSQTEFRERSRDKGSGWEMLSIETWSAVQLLYLIEFADFDSYRMLGSGYTDEEEWKTGRMGQTDGALYHTICRSGKSNMYRWIEDPFANCLDWIDGFEGSRKETYVRGVRTGITLPTPEIITGFGYSDACPWAFIPDSSGAECHEGACAFVSSYSSLYPAFVGGFYSDYANCGFFYFNAGNSASYAFGRLGSRLLYKP